MKATASTTLARSTQVSGDTNMPVLRRRMTIHGDFAAKVHNVSSDHGIWLYVHTKLRRRASGARPGAARATDQARCCMRTDQPDQTEMPCP
jgi:hypothetical protein